LGTKAGKWPQSYCVEALPNAYAWPGIGNFPELKLPQESEFRRFDGNQRNRIRERKAYLDAHQQTMTEWCRACATYLKSLHTNTSYRQAAQEFLDRQNREPQTVLDWWVYRSFVLRAGPIESTNEHLLLIKQYVLRRERKVEKIRREVESLERCGNAEGAPREPIPENVRLFVWQRDKGQCVQCGSRERLEFDHIIPVVAGGSNTERNVQLLCEPCNRSKGART
jgi:5-methylcytosine-specific restriction endonuclease McrA